MIAYRAFLQYFALLLTYATATYFAIEYGVVQDVWHTDFTYLTSIIAAFFAVSMAYLGYSTWRWDSSPAQVDQTFEPNDPILVASTEKVPNLERLSIARADTVLMRSAAYILTLLGLLGTVIGLMAQMKSMGALDLSNPNNIVGFIGSIGTNLGTALYCTATGIVAAVLVTISNCNLEWFLDKEEALND